MAAHHEIKIRCASRINGGDGADYRRCPKFATHERSGWALCEEHAQCKKVRPHKTAVKAAGVLDLLKYLAVPGLCGALKEIE